MTQLYFRLYCLMVDVLSKCCYCLSYFTGHNKCLLKAAPAVDYAKLLLSGFKYFKMQKDHVIWDRSSLSEHEMKIKVSVNFSLSLNALK